MHSFPITEKAVGSMKGKRRPLPPAILFDFSPDLLSSGGVC